MKAIILAAGLSRRMLHHTRDHPKCLLEVKEGKTILDLQLSHLRSAGVRDVVLVTGYLSHKIEEKVKAYSDMHIKILFNPFYEVSNNLMSLWLARDEMDDDFIFMNADNVFHPELIAKLVADVGEGVKLTVNRKPSEHLDSDDTKVITADNMLLALGKHLSHVDAHGESVGFIRFEGQAVVDARNHLERLARDPNNMNTFWFKLIDEFIKSGGVSVHEIDGEHWAEVDFPADLEHVRRHAHKFE